MSPITINIEIQNHPTSSLQINDLNLNLNLTTPNPPPILPSRTRGRSITPPLIFRHCPSGKSTFGLSNNFPLNTPSLPVPPEHSPPTHSSSASTSTSKIAALQAHIDPQEVGKDDVKGGTGIETETGTGNEV